MSAPLNAQTGTTKPRPKDTKASCPEEGCSHVGWTKNMSRHRQKHHPERVQDRVLKGIQERCPYCKTWFVKSQRLRHYKIKHQNKPVPATSLCRSRAPPASPSTTPIPSGERSRQSTATTDLGEPMNSPSDSNEDSDIDLTGESYDSEITTDSAKELPRARHANSVSDDDPEELSAVGYGFSEDDTLRDLDPDAYFSIKEPSAVMLSRIRDYDLRCSAGRQALVKATQDKVKMLDLAKPSIPSRLQIDLEEFSVLVNNAQDGVGISAHEYMQIVRRGDHMLPEHAYKYVVCSAPEARRIMDFSTPHFHLVIPQYDLNLTMIDGPGGFLDYLRTKDTVDVHTFNEPVETPNGEAVEDIMLPKTLSSARAVNLFRDQRGLYPINLLNLEAFSDLDDIRRLITGLRQWDILRLLRDNVTAGKQSEKIIRDLTNCAEFAICGTSGVFSLPHVDQAGFTTIVSIHEGEKQWLVSPTLTPEEARQWEPGQIGTAAFERPFFNLSLQQRDVLVQPPGRIHAPATSRDALGQGIMLWNSKDMLTTLKHMLNIRKYPTTTNEPDQTREANYKLNKIAVLWREGSELWPWGTDEELQEYAHLMDKYNEVYCDCEGRCARGCPCKHRRKKCGEYCHSTTPDDTCGNLATL